MQRWTRRLSSFALSNVPCSQDDKAISLSTQVVGHEFGEWLHVCRLQEPCTSDIRGRVSLRKVTCLVTISLQRNHIYSVTATLGVHQMDLILHFGKEGNELCVCDHQYKLHGR